MATSFSKISPKENFQHFITKGYLFASEMRRKAGVAPASHQPFTISMLGKPATIIRGEEAVDFFYDESKIERAGAMPAPISDALFGKGAVHTLDGEAHKVRKSQLAAMAYDDARVENFKVLVEEEMQRVIESWAKKPGNVYDDVAIAYGRAAFRWAGIPMSEKELQKRAEQYSHLLDNFGSPLHNALAQVDRIKLDKWAEKLIVDVRSGALSVDTDSVLAHMARLVDENGELVPAKTAGIELQNLTRPTVAVSRFAAFAAVALVQNRDEAFKVREAVVANGGSLINVPEAVAFAQEVRRAYPFVPMLPAFSKVDTEISGCPIHKGQRVLMDIVGTHNSPSVWEKPAEFKPDRWMDIEDYEAVKGFLPQGGAEVLTGHRCPGEKIAIAALSATVAAMSDEKVEISDDPVDTTFSWTSVLTRPSTGVRVRVKA